MKGAALCYSVPLEEARTREALAAACRKAAAELGRALEEEGFVFQEVSLEVETEDGRARRTCRLARRQPPENLCLHLERLLEKLSLPGPALRLAVAVGGLAPAAWRQEVLFGGRDRREEKLRRALEAAGGRCALAGSLGEANWRERMLSFYDPLRLEAGHHEAGAR